VAVALVVICEEAYPCVSSMPFPEIWKSERRSPTRTVHHDRCHLAHTRRSTGSFGLIDLEILGEERAGRAAGPYRGAASSGARTRRIAIWPEAVNRTKSRGGWHYDCVPSDENAVQGDFGEAWLEVVAAGCGLLHGRPATLDLQKADVQLTLRGWIGRTYNPTVMVQVKTEVGLGVDRDGHLVYNLDVPTYDVLRRDDHSVRRVLAVIGLVKDSARVRLHEDGTLLVGLGAWMSLEGYPETTNKASQVVRVPARNTLDEPGLRKMLGTYGVRRTFPAPDDDPWEVAKPETEGEEQ
jgi:hypothetical protein